MPGETGWCPTARSAVAATTLEEYLTHVCVERPAVSFGDGEDLEVGETVAPMQRIGVARKQECASASHVHAANPDDSDDVP